MEKIYKELYYYLFNQITDALSALERQDFGKAKDILIQAQQDAEEKYIGAEDET